jgi:hypothetical protein
MEEQRREKVRMINKLRKISMKTMIMKSKSMLKMRMSTSQDLSL